MAERRRSHWGWGWAERFPSREIRAALAEQLPELLGFSASEPDDPVPLEQLRLDPPTLDVPEELRDVLSDDRVLRVRHTYGRSYEDQLRAYRGDFGPAPDLVARPSTEEQVSAVLAWAQRVGAAVIPFGGGTSVCGGVTMEGRRPRVVLSLARMDQVLEVDSASLLARIQAGATGPRLEEQLAEHGLSLRHYPQSFEFSTLGGWIATRAGGHFATRYTHIDDLTAAIRMVTPTGAMQSRALPGSGAGPSPDRWMLGSEGVFGVITEAWMRVRPRPTHRARTSLRFADFSSGVQAVRRIAQARLYPSNCRLLDRQEARLNQLPEPAGAILLLGFESADCPVQGLLAQAVELAAAAGGEAGEVSTSGSWKQAFLGGPYLQSMLLSVGVIADTFETAVPWSGFAELHREVGRRVGEAMQRVGGAGSLSCRFTHVYPDGPAPYYTWVMPAERGREREQWREIKTTAARAVVEAGGTITHHHAVGRVHRPFVRAQWPQRYPEVLRAAKAVVDPAGLLNPGALIPPE